MPEGIAPADASGVLTATGAASVSAATGPVAGTSTAAAAAGQLHRRLSSFGVLLLTLSCLSPVFSIYGIGADVVRQAGTGAALLFLIGIAAALIWAMVYAEIGSAYPYAGGDYVGVGSILGPWAGFASLAVWAISLGPLDALLAQTIAVYLNALTPIGHAALITYAALAASVLIGLLAVRTSALVTGLFLGIEMLAVLALIGAGLWHPARTLGAVLVHPMAPGANGAWLPAAAGVLALNGVSAAFATAGGNQAVVFGEELAQPHRHMGRVVMLSGLIGALATALPVIAVVLGTRNPAQTFGQSAPFSAFLSSVAGPLAGRALSAGVVLALFNALIAQMMFTARLMFSFGRDEIFPRRLNEVLARVHGKSGAPRAATWAAGVLAAACCLLGSHVLLVFSTGLLVYSFGLVSSALLVGRLRGLTGGPGYWRSPLFPLVPVLGLGCTLVLVVSDILDRDVGRPSLLLFGALILLALAWYWRVLRPRGWKPRLP
jgi:amino acid transporter